MKKLKTIIAPIYKKFFLDFDYILKRNLFDCESILDLGCGHNSHIRFCDAKYKVGVELFDRYIKESQEKGIHNKYIKSDVTKVDFEPNSFDAIIMIDVLEHLKKEDALELIKKMNIWAKKKIIILTPNGFMHQENVDNNHLQDHLSGWEFEEFKKLGFDVYGINGLKHLRGDGALVKYKPVLFWIIISGLTQKIIYYFPKFAFHLYAIKNIKK
jgi:hypothetical protein